MTCSLYANGELLSNTTTAMHAGNGAGASTVQSLVATGVHTSSAQFTIKASCLQNRVLPIPGPVVDVNLRSVQVGQFR